MCSPKTPRGLEEDYHSPLWAGLAEHLAKCSDHVSLFQQYSRPLERIYFVFIGTFIKRWFRSDTDLLSRLFIRPGLITPSLLFDLASLKSELLFLFTLQSDTVNVRLCVFVICGSDGLCVCVKQECQEDAWILGSGLCGKISQEASPLSSILQGEKERKTILHEWFYWGTEVVYLTLQSENTAMKLCPGWF